MRRRVGQESRVGDILVLVEVVRQHGGGGLHIGRVDRVPVLEGKVRVRADAFDHGAGVDRLVTARDGERHVVGDADIIRIVEGDRTFPVGVAVLARDELVLIDRLPRTAAVDVVG